MSFFASLAASAWAGLLTLAFFIDVTYASCGHNVKLGNKVTTEVDSSTFTNVLPVQKCVQNVCAQFRITGVAPGEVTLAVDVSSYRPASCVVWARFHGQDRLSYLRVEPNGQCTDSAGVVKIDELKAGLNLAVACAS